MTMNKTHRSSALIFVAPAVTIIVVAITIVVAPLSLLAPLLLALAVALVALAVAFAAPELVCLPVLISSLDHAKQTGSTTNQWRNKGIEASISSYLASASSKIPLLIDAASLAMSRLASLL